MDAIIAAAAGLLATFATEFAKGALSAVGGTRAGRCDQPRALVPLASLTYNKTEGLPA
ncbi:MAG: hypothetical protein V2A79_06125 [Planctomycetota bacterium]